MRSDLYAMLGVKPVVNAMGNVTMLGGSVLSPGVQEAMVAANHGFVSMEDLLDRSGQAIARLLGAEGAYVTSGAYAALVQGIAGIMTGDDPERIARLPDTAGMRNEFLLQKKSRYHYDRCISAAGAKMIEVGDETGTTAAQMRAAIGPNTAGVLYFARMEGTPGLLSIAEVVEIARESGIQVILDAAGEIYPLERMTGLPQSGADLICFGAKYLGSANSSGILCGRRDAVAAARLNGFSAYEARRNRAMARGYKIDRQEIVGTLVALQEWLQMDHEERLQQQASRIETIVQGLADLPHVQAENVWQEEGGAWMRLRVRLDASAVGRTAAQVAAELKAGEPSIWVRVEGDDLYLAVHTLQEGEDRLVSERLRQQLA